MGGVTANLKYGFLLQGGTIMGNKKKRNPVQRKTRRLHHQTSLGNNDPIFDEKCQTMMVGTPLGKRQPSLSYMNEKKGP